MQVTRNLGHNGNGQVFVLCYWYDGSVSQDGPFATGEAASAEIFRQEREDREWADAQADAEAARGPEFPYGEFPF